MLFISILLLSMVISIPSIKNHISSIIFQRLSTIILIYAGALAFNAFYIQSIGSGIGIYGGLFHITFLSQLFDIFIFVIGAWILIARSSLINKNGVIITNNYLNTVEYSLIVLFSTLGASLLISTADLMALYLCIELQSLALYVLISIYRNIQSATVASLKYFLLGSLSSCFILLGIGIIYAFTGLTNIEAIYSLFSSALTNSELKGIIVGFFIIFIGLLFKIAAAPLHNWSPDVYDESPTIVTIWISIMPKISILIFLLSVNLQFGGSGSAPALQFGSAGSALASAKELIDLFSGSGSGSAAAILAVADAGSGSAPAALNLNNSFGLHLPNNGILAPPKNLELKDLLLISALLSFLIGSVVGLAQTKIKRLLAYSTVSHIGFLLLALGINSQNSTQSFIFYTIQYTLTNLNTFLLILAIGYIIKEKIVLNKGSEQDINFINELEAIFYSNPILAFSLTISLLSLAGIPPLLGFFSKQFVLSSAIESGYIYMSIIGILISIISTSYYLRIIKLLWLRPSNIIENKSKFKSNMGSGSGSGSALATALAPPAGGKGLATHASGSGSRPQSEASAAPAQNLKYISPISNIHSFSISILTLVILFFVIKPNILLIITQLLSLYFFDT
jgi:NADH-ubiquinone oxidoreductase chain 2